MSNLAAVLREEISRLAKKEARAAVAPMKETIADLKKTAAEQKRQLKSLEKEVAMLNKKLGLDQKIDLPSTEEVESARITPATIVKLRKKFDLSRNQFAKVLGVNSNSIYLWEQGKAAPRATAKAKILSAKALGKRDIKKLLEEN